MLADIARQGTHQFGPMGCPTFQSSWPGTMNVPQISPLRRRANQWFLFARPCARSGGAFRDRHERWVRDAMDALASPDERRQARTAKSCGLDASTLASSRRGSIHAGDGGKKARSPERARRKPLKPLARGKPDVFGGPAVTCLRAFFICTQGCGCIDASGFPCALPSRWATCRKTRAICAARTRRCVLTPVIAVKAGDAAVGLALSYLSPLRGEKTRAKQASGWRFYK
jgi:hypothetical protein